MHVTAQARVEGDIQLRLLDAWESVQAALDLAGRPEFGSGAERREWKQRVKCLRGCLVMAAARLIDIQHLAAFGTDPNFRVEVAGRRERIRGESSIVDLGDEVRKVRKQITLMCPLGIPDMRFGLGRVASSVERGEVELVPFFGLPSPAECARRSSRAAAVELKERKRKLLGLQDELLAAASKRVERSAREAAEDVREHRSRRVAEQAAEMRRRAGVE